MYPALMNGNYGQSQSQQPMMSSSQPMTMMNPTSQSIMGTPGMPSYAHGGRVKKSSLTLAHMSPHELHFLDHLQGGTERHNKSGIRSYSHLEEILKNPHIKANIHHHAYQHHAQGGDANDSHEEVEHMAHMGRGGDTEMALIGPNTHHLFNQWAGHSTRNPHDGHPEYFSLGGLFSGMSNALKGAGSKIMPALASAGRAAASAGRYALPKLVSAGRAALPTLAAAGQAALPALSEIATQRLGNKYGDMGAMAGQMGSHLVGHALNSVDTSGANPLGATIGRGAGAFASSKNRGESNSRALGSGLIGASRDMGKNTAMGSMLGGMGRNIQGGMGAKDIFRNVAPEAFSNLANAGQQAMQARGSGQGFGDAMRSGLKTLNPYTPQDQASQEETMIPDWMYGEQ